MQEPMKTSVRTRLIEAAANLAHQHGFGNTRLADIAKAAKVPPGNLYYYFKTKEEIGEAIVERRLSELQAAQQELGKVATPRERLCRFVLISIEQREMLAQHGCPIGSFCSELNKEGGLLARKASRPFADLLMWTEAQFREFCSKGEARGHAVHLMSAIQGATLLANCAKDSDLIKMEAKRLVDWIRSL
jgi:AcrR family transcriptional regulator